MECGGEEFQHQQSLISRSPMVETDMDRQVIPTVDDCAK